MAWSAGSPLTAAQFNTYVPQTWTAYTPTVTPWTMSSSWFRYQLAGKTLHLAGFMIGATYPAGNLVITLPSGITGYMGGISEYRAVGTWHALRSGVARYSGVMALTTLGAQFIGIIDNTGAHVSSTAPATWVAGDHFNFAVKLETV